MDKSSDNNASPDWKKEQWASREEKKKEVLARRDEPSQAWLEKSSWNWKEERRNNEIDPLGYIGRIKEELNSHHEETLRGIVSGKIIDAENSGDDRLVKMQEMIDQMSLFSDQLEALPKLVFHTPDSDHPNAKKQVSAAFVVVPGFIEMNDSGKKYLLAQSPESAKMILAHELGHLANGDRTAHNILRKYISPPGQMKEILADRMGAILHGNPRKYAEAVVNLRFPVPEQAHIYTDLYLSSNGSARMLHKWADILEAAGATDKDGNIILSPDRSGNFRAIRALAVFEKSKDLTEEVLKIDQLKLEKDHAYRLYKVQKNRVDFMELAREGKVLRRLTSNDPDPKIKTLVENFESLTGNELVKTFLRSKPKLYVMHSGPIPASLEDLNYHPLNAYVIDGDKLIIGDKLIDLLTPAEMQAWLAHELGHLLRQDEHMKRTIFKTLRNDNIKALYEKRPHEALADQLAVYLLGNGDALKSAENKRIDTTLNEIRRRNEESPSELNAQAIVDVEEFLKKYPITGRMDLIDSFSTSMQSKDGRESMERELYETYEAEHRKLFPGQFPGDISGKTDGRIIANIRSSEEWKKKLEQRHAENEAGR